MSESFTVYNADCWCDACGKKIKQEIAGELAKSLVDLMAARFPQSSVVDRKPGGTYGNDTTALIESVVEALIEHLDDCTCDTDDWPSSGHPEEEVDSPSHCGSHAECEEAEELPDGTKIGKLLGTSLTPHGVEYVKEYLLESALAKDGPNPVTVFWNEQFDGYDFAMPLRVKVTDIDYDTDEDEKPTDLPKEMIVDVEENPLDNDAIADAALDVVSDKTGWAINSAQFQVLDPASPNYPKEDVGT